MVIYVEGLWVLETNTEGLKVDTELDYVVYNPMMCKGLFYSNDLNECIKQAEKINDE